MEKPLLVTPGEENEEEEEEEEDEEEKEMEDLKDVFELPPSWVLPISVSPQGVCVCVCVCVCVQLYNFILAYRS